MQFGFQFIVTLVTLIFSVITTCLGQNIVNIIPLPAEIIERKGHLDISGRLSLFSNVADLNKGMQVLQDQLKLTSEIQLQFSNDESTSDILLLKAPELKPGQYQLDITDKKIRIRAFDAQGVFYASQTLMQLFPVGIYGNNKVLGKKISLPCLWINDYPRFEYRGMHLDVCRHFFPKEFIKKYIDYLAMHKMNFFHWHLTEDQGWRIEIKKYPKLTEIGGSRKETLIGSYNDVPHKFDQTKYSGFYTQDDIREIVSYASKRFITIVPEIEMPGHALAALAAYPELSCNEKSLEVATIWGVFEDVFCPKESTFEFLENVLTEVTELFPGPYIHIGGDECPKVRWKTCQQCQTLMKREGLKSEEELQSYFIQRIEKFINSKGKRIIGWDEILEGGLAPNATVMSWRGIQGGIEAAREHHNVIMTPGSHCYFDHYQSLSLNEPVAIGGYTSVMKVYDFEPIPSELNVDEAKYVIGAQGNVWTEYILDGAHVEYMALPRMSALAEVVWTPANKRNKADFRIRLTRHMQRLKEMKTNFATHIFDPEIKTKPIANGNLEITLLPAQQTDIIRYAYDRLPNSNDPVYEKPIIMDHNGTFQFQTQGTINGSLLSITFEQSASLGAKIELKDNPSEKYPGSDGASTLVNGLRGGKRFNGQNWLGFSGKNLDAKIDLGEVKSIKELSVGTIVNIGAWIHPPKNLLIYTSIDGTNFELISNEPVTINSQNIVTTKFSEKKTRYVKIILENQGIIPTGNPGAGNAAWLFADEIIIK